MSSSIVDLADGRPAMLDDYAFERIRDEIVRGELAPGRPLRLREHAARLGISPIPIREAMKQLEEYGLVVWLPHRGVRVAEMSVTDMEDTYRIRLALESLAIREAVQRLIPRDEADANAKLDRYAELLGTGAVEAARKAHAAFHLALYRPTDSRWLDRLIPQLWDSAERYRRLAIPGLGTIDDRIGEHRKLYDVWCARDPNAAERALQRHFERTQRVIRERLSGEHGASTPGDARGPARGHTNGRQRRSVSLPL